MRRRLRFAVLGLVLGAVSLLPATAGGSRAGTELAVPAADPAAEPSGVCRTVAEDFGEENQGSSDWGRPNGLGGCPGKEIEPCY